MAKLVVLNEGLTGQSYELKTDKTTIGRVDDNAFQIAQGSVSSHHCEILLRGGDIIIRDLNSTNGTFINGQQITGEALIKPGEMLRLGQVELRLDTGAPGQAAPSPAPAPAAAPAKKVQDTTMTISTGVKLDQLGQGSQAGLDTTKGVFTKKTNKTNRYFIWGGAVFIFVIVCLLGYLFYTLSHASH
jgi:predicted component of type VI protein secretion system